MNFAHVHLVVTHFPPVLSVLGAVSATAGVMLRRQRRDLERLARATLIVAGVLTPVAYLAGNRAADTIGRVEGIDQQAIAPHQAAARNALIASIGAALVAIAAVVVERRRRRVPVALAALVVIAAIASAALIGRTAALGGAIHHPEIGA